MALSSAAKRKEVKKSSYYVWFLGAKESRGLRGEEYIRPVVSYLTEREAEVEPLKVTLQVSGKGLKIIQNSKPCAKGRPEVTKHFIPEHAITCVVQDSPPNDDVVACILLIYNPVSKCPVHVHAYRCDSVDTASILRQHLRALVDRPENQRKFGELERRLVSKGLLRPSPSIRTESDSSGGGSGSERDAYALDERMSNLYDSLAAELREKLNNKRNHGPMLLPPRDYDTAQKPAKGGRETGDSSGKSSGIGSDEAPSSPTHERGSTPPKKPLHDECSSDEEWERHRDPQAKTERDMILVQSPPSPRPRRPPSPQSSMHPPSPKLPPYRERYFEGKQPERYAAKRGDVEHSRIQAPYSSVERRSKSREKEYTRGSPEMEHSRFQNPGDARYSSAAERRSKSREGKEYSPERQIRHSKSRDEKDYVPEVKDYASGLTRRSKSRDDKDFVPDEKDYASGLIRRSKSRDEKDYVPEEKTYASGSPERMIRRSKSRDEKDYVQAPHAHLAHSRSFDRLEERKPDYTPYVPPLPRVRRLDSGQSSMPSSAGGPPRYQEIPNEKRYPGLDRETARVQHHYASKGREPQWGERDRYRGEYEYPPARAYRPVFPYAKASPERPLADRGPPKRPQEAAKEDRFYRYSSSDPEYRPSGYRMSAAAGYHY